MFRYRGFGMTIDSELELPELARAEGEPDITIMLGSVPLNQRKATLREAFAFNSVAGGFHVTDGRQIIVQPRPGVAPAAVRVILLGRVMAFLMRQRGWAPLHASGVVVGGRAVLFFGCSGSGKSTTAAAFHVAGHPVITDDVAPVQTMEGKCLVRPSWPRLRLLDDARGILAQFKCAGEFQLDKHSYELSGSRLESTLPVARIYFLEYGAEIGTETIPALTAVALLDAHSFRTRRGMDESVIARQFSICGSIVHVMPVHRLTRPASLKALPDLVRLVQAEVAKDEC